MYFFHLVLILRSSEPLRVFIFGAILMGSCNLSRKASGVDAASAYLFAHRAQFCGLRLSIGFATVLVNDSVTIRVFLRDQR